MSVEVIDYPPQIVTNDASGHVLATFYPGLARIPLAWIAGT